jgi:hypothetical protein
VSHQLSSCVFSFVCLFETAHIFLIQIPLRPFVLFVLNHPDQDSFKQKRQFCGSGFIILRMQSTLPFILFKGTVPRHFDFWFFHESISPDFFQNLAEIFAPQGAPLVSTPVENGKNLLSDRF